MKIAVKIVMKFAVKSISEIHIEVCNKICSEICNEFNEILWNPVGFHEILWILWISWNPVAFSKIVLDSMTLCEILLISLILFD